MREREKGFFFFFLVWSLGSFGCKVPQASVNRSTEKQLFYFAGSQQLYELIRITIKLMFWVPGRDFFFFFFAGGRIIWPELCGVFYSAGWSKAAQRLALRISTAIAELVRGLFSKAFTILSSYWPDYISTTKQNLSHFRKRWHLTYIFFFSG